MLEPFTKKIKKIVKFGKVGDEERGDNIMDPPLEIEDNYYWLRDDTRNNKEVLNYLHQENDYTKNVMEDTKDLQSTIYDELISRLKEDYDSYPYPVGTWDSPYRYFTRTKEGKSYAIYCRINMKTDETEVYLDVNDLAEGHTNFDVSGVSVSNNHKILSYAVDADGDEKYNVVFYDLETKTKLYKELKQIPYANYCLAPDNNTIFYTMGDEANRICKLYKTSLDSDESVLLYEEKDTLFSIGFGITKTDKYLILSTSSSDTNEQYFMNYKLNSTKLTLIKERIDNIKYSVDHHENNFIIVTNKDNSSNFKVMWCPEDNYQVEQWEDIKKYDKNEYIEDVETFKNHIVVSLKKNGLNELAIINYIDEKYSNEWKYIKIDEPVYDIGSSINCVYDTNNFWYSYNSMTKPASLFEYNLNTEECSLLRTREVPNYNSDLYESKRLFASSNYGAKIPMSMVYRKDMKKNGSQPLQLYAYGAYGHNIDPSFSSKIISLLDRGFIYVIAHVRGSSTMGYDWYLDGKMYNKMNTFNDFNLCAEYLIKENYTKPELLTIEGRSAGGLTVGASMVLRPDLYNSVVGVVPFVDVLTTMSDTSIPLTTPEWMEWGNPNKIEDYTYMKQYSPMDNIRKVNYPHTLMLAGLNDPRVQYWEPTKFNAKIREYKTDSNYHLLKTEMDAGHFGGNDRYRHMKEEAFIYAFIIKTMNI
jgi:oligopeptidase B